MAIPRCEYLIRKGEAPASDRSNIFAWSPHLAEKEDKFEQFSGKLPGLEKPKLEPHQDPEPPDIEHVRTMLLFEAIKKLDPTDDYTSTGLPRLSSLENIVGFPVDGKARDSAFAYFKSEYARKNGKL